MRPWLGRCTPASQRDQRRFAGAILAEQHMHLARAEIEIDAVERDDPGEMLRDALEAEQGRNA